MSKTLIDVGDEYLGHLKYDKNFYNKISEFRIKWSQKDDNYIEFLGGNLTGVHPIRFSTVDEDTFFIDILNIDQNSIRNDFFKVDGIDKDRKVTSNVTYLTIIYLMHKVTISTTLGEYRIKLLKELYYIFAYKVISGRIAHYFKYDVEPAIAKVVFEKLSNRFLIKRLGSWQKVFEYRAKDILPPEGLHAGKLIKLTTDDGVKIIADMQGRIREIIKNIYVVLMEVKDQNEKIYSSSMIVDDEEGSSTRDSIGSYDNYARYVRTIIESPNDFINDDLVYLVTTVIKNIDRDKFIDTLKYISKNIKVKPESKDDFIKIAIETTINYSRTKNIVGNYNKHIYNILIFMKGYWSSSSVRDTDVKHIKNYLNNVAQTATGKKTKWLLATITIGVLLYIFLRAIVKNK